jgi:hypothetical protein
MSHMVDAEQTTEAPLPPQKPVRRRAPKPDQLIAESVELALAALREEFPDEEIGEHLGALPDDERVMTHRFAGAKRGYCGWQWYATLARAPRAKNVTVCELGLLPSDDAVLAPPWVPWVDRIRPEDIQDEAAEHEHDEAPADDHEEDSSEDYDDAAPSGDDQHHDEDRPQEGHSDEDDAPEDDLTAAEIEAIAAVKRRTRRRRYKARSRT